DGKNVKFTDITTTVRATYNSAPTSCLFVPSYMAELLHKNIKRYSHRLKVIFPDAADSRSRRIPAIWLTSTYTCMVRFT
ncbi:hypothetical protein B0H19DRAFT_943626, partial [Mycena capillaripes]